jgi:hypothetical protein
MLPLGWNGDFMNRNVPITKSGIVAVYPDISTVKTGSFTGDGTANRAIPHGLDSVPLLIYIYANVGTSVVLQGSSTRICTLEETNEVEFLSVSAPDDTNFYVGVAYNFAKSCNSSGVTYRWVAIS